MAKLPPLKQFLAQDFQSAGPWIGKFLYVLNLFMGSVYSALNNQLTVADNMVGQINTVSSISGANPTTTINWGFVSAPVGVNLINVTDTSSTPAPITTATTCQWSYSAGVITIINITGLSSTRTYSCTFQIIGG